MYKRQPQYRLYLRAAEGVPAPALALRAHDRRRADGLRQNDGGELVPWREMCIRDRRITHTLLDDNFTERQRTGDDCLARHTARKQHRGIGPVSYTHLRRTSSIAKSGLRCAVSGIPSRGRWGMTRLTRCCAASRSVSYTHLIDWSRPLRTFSASRGIAAPPSRISPPRTVRRFGRYP